MSLAKQDLHKVIDSLNEQQTHSVYDFAKYLVDRQMKDFWDQVDASPADKEPLTEEEQEQMKDRDDFTSLEDAKRELEI